MTEMANVSRRDGPKGGKYYDLIMSDGRVVGSRGAGRTPVPCMWCRQSSSPPDVLSQSLAHLVRQGMASLDGSSVQVLGDRRFDHDAQMSG
jgi:hypothetical protein